MKIPRTLFFCLISLFLSHTATAAPGDLLWEDHVSGSAPFSSDEFSNAVTVAGDKVFAVGWTTSALGAADFTVRAYDVVTGALLWADTYDRAGKRDRARAVAIDSGRVFVAGNTRNAAGNRDFTVRAYDAKTGAVLWANTYDRAGGRDRAWAVAATRNGVFAAGFAYTTSTGRDFSVRAYDAGAVSVAVDIKPQACPNLIDVKGRGVLKVAILGTPTFDVNNIDLNSIELAGISPHRYTFKDVSTPFSNGGGDPCLNCTEEGPDGELDLVLKFDKRAVVEALGEVSNGDCVEMTLNGELLDGTPISGSDHVLVRKKGKR